MTIEPLGDSAFLVSLGEQIDAATTARVQELTRRIDAAALPWIVEVVPAYASIGVFVDPLQFAAPDGARQCARALEKILVDRKESHPNVEAREIEIPVCYGGDFGPDFADVMARSGLEPEEVIRRHAAARYTVGCVGFTPGFPYLIGLPPILATPRRVTPRRDVPAGSVGIGGGQTGIYPQRSPGGWNIIGRTPLALFSPTGDPPALLQPGDRVRFVPISAEAFTQHPG